MVIYLLSTSSIAVAVSAAHGADDHATHDCDLGLRVLVTGSYIFRKCKASSLWFGEELLECLPLDRFIASSWVCHCFVCEKFVLFVFQTHTEKYMTIFKLYCSIKSPRYVEAQRARCFNKAVEAVINH